MEPLYKVFYEIKDQGTTSPELSEEVKVPDGKTVYECLKKKLNTYKHAMNLTDNFTVRITLLIAPFRN